METKWRDPKSYKRSGTTLNSLKQANKMSVSDRQSRGREDVITRKRLRFNTLLECDNDMPKKSSDEQYEKVLLAIKSLRKGDKSKTLTELHRLFASQGSNADLFLKHDGIQPLHSCFRSYSVDVLHASAWCVINLSAAASSIYSSALLGLAPTLMQFLKGSDVVMQELCAWGLANLAGDSKSNADVLHKQGCTDALLGLLGSSHVHNEDREKSVLFALINLARSNLSCVRYMHSKDILSQIQILLNRTPESSSLNYEIGWLLCSIYPGFNVMSFQPDHLSNVARTVSGRLNGLNNITEDEQNHPSRDKVCLPFVRCLCNLIGLNSSISRVMLDDVRSFRTIHDLLSSGQDNLKQEILVLINNCVVDVCSRILFTFQPNLFSQIISECRRKEPDLSIQALAVIQAMARTSALVDSYLLQCGVLTTLTDIINNSASLLCGNNQEELMRGEGEGASQLDIAVGVLLDLAYSQPDMVRRKLEEEQSKEEFNNTLKILAKIASSNVQQVDANLAHQASLLLHIFGLP